MRVFCLRHRVLPGDRIVVPGLNGNEYLSRQVKVPGTSTAVLVDGSLVPYPEGKGLMVERAADEDD